MESTWVQSYYDTLEFFYWEPQHLGRKKYVDSKLNSIGKVRHHLRQLEVTLNHQLLMLLRLGPPSLRNNLAAAFFSTPPQAPLVLHDRDAEQALWKGDVMQPDVFLRSASDVFCIEMKIGAKCDIEQVVKYAVLGMACEIDDGLPRQHHFGLLGRESLRRQWALKIEDIDALRQRLREADLQAILKRCPAHLRSSGARLREIVDSMALGFLNYSDLARFLESQQPPDTDRTEGAAVYRNLLQGFLGELESRKLT